MNFNTYKGFVSSKHFFTIINTQTKQNKIKTKNGT